jgi:hypothetical protein
MNPVQRAWRSWLWGSKGVSVCAKKLGKGGSDVSNIMETFRRNPAGNQSRLVEPGPQPEASLAWGGEIRTAKRRQRVLMPCDGAPKLPLVESPRRTLCVGPCRPTAMALSRKGRARRGLRAGRRHMRVLQELWEARIVSRRHSPELETGLRTPGPRLCVVDRWERNDRRAAWYRQAKETKRGERDGGSRTSS